MTLNQIIECIPNISEGRNDRVLKEITAIIRKTEEVQLLDVDSGIAVNRSVFTFIGPPEAVIETAYNIYKYISLNLDMRRHKGVHPRLGMVDVCPFVPVKNISISELNFKVWRFGKRVGYDFKIPVYFYEYSALSLVRKRLESIRKGEYELLSENFYSGKSIPDVGPLRFNYKTGATVMGVRNFLIAFNVELDTTSVEVARKMASKLRIIRNTPSLSLAYSSAVIERNGHYNLDNFKVIGWELEDIGKVQLSMNLTNHKESPVFLVYELVKSIANEFGVGVGNSELIGMIPMSAIEDIACYLSITTDRKSKIREVFAYLSIPDAHETKIINDLS
jgi:glutamate formiminotransferase